MKANRTPACVLALMAIAAFAVCRADEAAKPAAAGELRGAIGRSLDFLAKEGDEWMAKRDCNGCHHMPELLWSHREAKLRGFVVDQKKFDEWIAWAGERATNKQPGLEQAALMLLALPERPAPELTKLIAAEQKPDGSWNPGNQFATMQQRGVADARANSMRLFLLALATPQPPVPDAETARAKAAALLRKNEPPTAVESLVFNALYARCFGKPEDVDASQSELLKLQHGDGGWASRIGEEQSDALATGQALYALNESRDPNAAGAVAHAHAWLLGTQQKDGSWLTDITLVSKIDRSAPAKAKSLKDATAIYHYWGTAWATIGLLQSVPVARETAQASEAAP